MEEKIQLGSVALELTAKCNQRCSYCLSGDTPILMGDGTHKLLRDIRVGDEIYGTVRQGLRRRYVKTQVLAHFPSIKPAYRITLEDGTELVASADHRFLTERGWKYVAEEPSGGRRPHLTTNNQLIGFGASATTREGNQTDSKSLEGQRVKSGERLRVASVMPLGKTLPMFDITTGTEDFIANGVVSHNCYNAWRDDGGAAVGELPFAKLKEQIEKLFREAEVEHITLTGGEPFLRPDLHEIIDLVNSHGAEVVIISNGGVIREENAKKLAQQGVVHVQLSFAGADEATHDEVCGKSSFRRCVEAATLLREAGVAVCGSFICSKRSAAGAREVFRLMASLGIERVAFNRFNPSGYGTGAASALLPSRSQVIQALAEAEAAAEELGLDITCTMPIPPCMIEEERYPHLSFGHCSAGLLEGEVALGPDGQLKLCTLQKNGVGDFSKVSLVDMIRSGAFEEFRQKIPAFCEGCPHASTCLGGCGASAEWIFGDAGELDPFLAQHVMPELWQKLRGGGAK